MAVEKALASSSLVEVVDRILDKGIVIDAWIRISLAGIGLLSIEARAVVASFGTFLKYAEAVGLVPEVIELPPVRLPSVINLTEVQMSSVKDLSEELMKKPGYQGSEPTKHEISFPIG